MKLRRYVATSGSRLASAERSAVAGARRSSTIMVIKIAITPSLKASSRALLTSAQPRQAPVRRQVSSTEWPPRSGTLAERSHATATGAERHPCEAHLQASTTEQRNQLRLANHVSGHRRLEIVDGGSRLQRQ